MKIKAYIPIETVRRRLVYEWVELKVPEDTKPLDYLKELTQNKTDSDWICLEGERNEWVRLSSIIRLWATPY